MNKNKFSQIVVSMVGILMVLVGLDIFFAYYLLVPPWEIRIRMIFWNLFAALLKGLVLPSIMLPIFGFLMLVLGLLFILWGLLSSLVILISTCSILMFVLGVISVFLGSGFFFYPVGQIAIFSLYPLLILISGILYIGCSLFLLKRKIWARKWIIIHSVFLILYFMAFSICISMDPWGWGKLIVFSIMPYIIFPIFFIIFLMSPKIKSQFKK